MVNWPRIALMPAIVAALVGLAACGSGATSAAPPTPTAPPAASAGDMQGMNHSGGKPGQLELWAVQTGPLGVVVTDGGGQLIYRSDRDGNAPSVSNCTGDCAATWHPVTVDLNLPPILLGVDEDAVGVAARPDGSDQLTIAGWPLYRRAGEGGGTLSDTRSNGADDVWFAIRPDGEKAAPPAG